MLRPTTIEADGASIEAALVPWDTRSFGFPVAQISRIEIGEGRSSTALLERFDEWCAAHDIQLVSCRLEHTKLRESMLLEDAGFRFVEMVYEPRLDRLDGFPEPTHRIDVAEAVPADVASIAAIAGEAFRTGRYRLDWRLPAELSDRRYAEWARNSFQSREQQVLKAESEGDLVGFFIVERRPDGVVYWHLTAIAPEHQGQGFGLSVWQAMLRRHRAEGATAVRTTISGHNVPVMNLYARLGFSFSAPQMTFHRLRGR